mmetsp:Transcript_107808/g.336220  ORF Transcript_107808/g.336220 Transcript_107808/m.336220 type:complete len:215 (+) Transcript_107808:1087-1731(+)
MRWLDADLIVVSLHVLLVADVLSEQLVDGLLDGRDGDELLDAVLVRHAASHTVVKGDPLGELLHVIPHALIFGVEEVSAVLAGPDAVSCHIVVAVAAYVITLVQDDGGHPQLLRAPLRDHAAGEARAHDQQVDLGRAGGEVAALDLAAEVQGRVGQLATLAEQVFAALSCHPVQVAIRRGGAEREGARAACARTHRADRGPRGNDLPSSEPATT